MSAGDADRDIRRAAGRRLADEFLSRQGGQSWLEELHRRSSTDPSVAAWSEISPNPLLIDWLAANHQPPVSVRAAVIGCGLGDNAEELADWGFRVTAIDPSRSAVEWCRDRFVGSAVTYVCAELLDLPGSFVGGFDLVVAESVLENVLPADRCAAVEALSRLLAPGGKLLVICRARPGRHRPVGGPPWPLSKAELLSAVGTRLRCVRFEDIAGAAEAPARCFRAVYERH